MWFLYILLGMGGAMGGAAGIQHKVNKSYGKPRRMPKSRKGRAKR